MRVEYLIHIFGEKIEHLLNNFIYQSYIELSNYIARPLGSLCILYIVLVGFGIVRGVIKTPLQEFVKGAFRIGVVFMLAMNWGFFAKYIYDLFTLGVNELCNVLHPFKGSVAAKYSDGVYDLIQHVFNVFIKIGSHSWMAGGVKKIGSYLVAIIVYGSGIVIAGICFIEIMVAKFIISLCLATAPLFVTFVLFDKTRNLFIQWLNQMIAYAFVCFFVSIVITFSIYVVNIAVADNFALKQDVSANDWIPLVFCAFIVVKSVREVVNLAKNIGGSLTNSDSSFVSNVISKNLATSLYTKQSSFNNSLVDARQSGNKSDKDKSLYTAQNRMSAIQHIIRGVR